MNVFLSLSVSLRQMCGTLWPGLPTEGILWFKDLTLPALELSPLACPLGVSGLLVPLGLFWLFLQSVEASPIGEGGGVRGSRKAGKQQVGCVCTSSMISKVGCGCNHTAFL